MKKTVIYTMIMILYSAFSYGQNVNYTITKNNPDDIRNLGINLIPFNVDTWSDVQTSISYGISGDFFLGDKLSFYGHYFRSYLLSEEYTKPNGNEMKYNNIEAIGAFVLSKNYKNKEVKVNLSTTETHQSRTSTYIKVDAKKKRMFKVRGGINFISTPYDVSNVIFEPINDQNGEAVGIGTVRNSLNLMNICAGISYSFHSNLKVNVSGYGNKGNGMYNNIYFDFQTAPMISTQDIEVDGEVLEISGGDNGLLFKRLGWRLGYDFSWNKSNLIDFNAKAEVGSRPGFKDKGFYMLANFGLTIRLM